MTQRPVWEQLKVLEQLQELDLRIDGLKGNRKALPALLNTLDTSLAQLERTISQKQAAIEELDKTNRQTRAALDLNKDRQTRSSGRLENVQNSHEFQAVSKEIEQITKMNLGLEEQMKKADADKATLAAEVQALSEQVAKVRAEREAQATAVSGQTHELDSQITAVMSDRTTLAAQVDRRVLSQYDRVRAARSGIGIVPAIAGRCKGCNMVLTPQLYNMIQKGAEIHSCPSCHRLLFAPQNKPAETNGNQEANM